MNAEISAIKWQDVLLYVDDIVGFSRLASKKTEHLKDVVEPLSDAEEPMKLRNVICSC